MTCTMCDDPLRRCPRCHRCFVCGHARTDDYWWVCGGRTFRLTQDGAIVYREEPR